MDGRLRTDAIIWVYLYLTSSAKQAQAVVEMFCHCGQTTKDGRHNMGILYLTSSAKQAQAVVEMFCHCGQATKDGRQTMGIPLSHFFSQAGLNCCRDVWHCGRATKDGLQTNGILNKITLLLDGSGQSIFWKISR